VNLIEVLDSSNILRRNMPLASETLQSTEHGYVGILSEMHTNPSQCEMPMDSAFRI